VNSCFPRIPEKVTLKIIDFHDRVQMVYVVAGKCNFERMGNKGKQTSRSWIPLYGNRCAGLSDI
jgi:hypothetical protein